jgi:uncharacterized protein (TIGR02186 family)
MVKEAMRPLAVTLAIVLMCALGVAPTQAQRTKGRATTPTEVPHSAAKELRRQQPGAKESVEADVSARNVAVRADFNGVEIVVFGAVDNSQQPSPESGYYDVIIVVEGVPARVIVRRKDDVAGLWVNTTSVTFDNVPSFYAIASTRPLEEVAPDEFRTLYRIGQNHLRLLPAFAQAHALSNQNLEEFRQAISRLKQRAGLYIQAPFAVQFTGSSLFSAHIVLPANITVGPFDTRVYLLHDQKLLSEYSVRLHLEREGLERYLHAFAFGYPLLYGLATNALAVACGLIASRWFTRTAA